MATVKKKSVDKFTITFSRYEAMLLLMLCDSVGGEEDGPRGIFSDAPGNISDQLETLGVKRCEGTEGSIYSIYFI